MENTVTIPLNPEGALELNLNPCDYCQMGSAAWDSNGKVYDCRDDCEYHKRYQKKIKENDNKTS